MTILRRIYPFYIRVAPLLVVAGLLLLAVQATGDFLFATGPHGIGVRTDSVAYLWGAENLAKGLGLGRLNGLGELKPMTHWPPLYPLVLSLFELAGMPALAGARLLGAVLVGLTLLLSGLTVWRVTRSLWFSLGAAALLAMAPSLWVTSLDAMTEPLYVVLGLAGALLLDVALSRPGSAGRWPFVLSALCMALALLTRYAGVALIAAAGLVLLLQRSQPWPARLKQAALYGALCLAPLLLWMARNQLVAGSATNRALNIIPIAASDWSLLAQTISGWLSPLQTAFAVGPGKLALIAAALGLFAAFSLAEWEFHKSVWFTPPMEGGNQPKSTMHLPLFYTFYALIYPAFVVFSRLAFDRMITIFEERIAFPWFHTLLLLLVFAAWALLRRAQAQTIRTGQAVAHLRAGLLAAALVALNVVVAYSFGVGYSDQRAFVLDETWRGGRGLNTPQALKAPFSVAARAVDSRRVIYTDNIEILYFVSGQHAFQANEADQGALDSFRDMLREHDLAFIFFYDAAVPQLVQREFPQARVRYQQDGNTILELDRP